MKFKQLNIQEFIQEALSAIHFDNLTPVQEEVIPPAIEGKNLVVQSQTGSGKTHSFLIPILERIQPEQHHVQAVITAPSRELAVQIYEAMVQLTTYSADEIVVNLYVGGTDKVRQIDKLAHRQPHIVVGTPGRIFDLMSENALWVQTATMLVVDEADMTMDLGFLQIVDDIASRMASELQMMVFSATIPQGLRVFLDKYVSQTMHIAIEPKQVLSEQINNYLISTKGKSRKALVYELLTMGHPYLALVFCNTKAYAQEVSEYLKDKGLKIATIHGDVPARERKRLMKQIKDLEYQYVVASDLAARGIDIPGVSMVINTEVPKDLEFFIHRVGRTGRHKISGNAYTFVTPEDDHAIIQLEKKGIEFQQVEIQNSEIVPVKARNSRKLRVPAQQDTQDPVVRGMIAQQKNKKVKPGYKRKLNEQIKKHQKQVARRQRKQAMRNKRSH